jgi:hypothetical protein
MRRRAASEAHALAALAIAIALATPPERAGATPQDLVGFGARSQGLALTGVSYGEDYEATYSNPAGLARARRRGIHIGLSAGAYALHVDGERDPLEPMRGMTIGATLPLPFHDVLENRLVLGIGVYTPQQVLLRGRVLFADVPQWAVVDRAQSLAIQIGLGVDLHGTDLEGLRIGAGVSALANVIGDLDVRLDETRRFSSTVETQILTAFAPIVGVSYDRGEWTAGLVYRHELRSELDLEIITADLPISLPVLTIGGLVQYDPAQVAAEVSYRPIPDLRLIAHLTLRLWSFYPGAQRGSSRSSLLAPAPELSETISPRVAAEGTIRKGPVTLAIRGGYAFELSPSPPARLAALRNPDGTPAIIDGEVSRIAFRYLDSDRHVLTAGLGLTYDFTANERLRLDLYGQLHLLADRTHTVARPGVSSDDASDWMRTGGLIVVGGWTVSLEF